MTVWYAQSNAGNVNDADKWKDGAAGGTSLIWGSHAAGDIFALNGKTAIALNADFAQCLRISNAIEGGLGSAGGWLVLNTTGLTRTVRGNVLAGNVGNDVILWSTTGGGTFWLYGNVTGGDANSAHGVRCTASGPTFKWGDASNSYTATGGSLATAHGIWFNGGAGTHTFYGNAVGGAGGVGIRYSASFSDAITWIGDASAHANSPGFDLAYGILYHTGAQTPASNGRPGVAVGPVGRYYFEGGNTINWLQYASAGGGTLKTFYQRSADALATNIRLGKVIDGLTGEMPANAGAFRGVF